MTNVVQNNEFLNATQDAVLDAVNVIEAKAHELSLHHNEPFYLSAEFWVAMSFVLTVAVLFVPVYLFLYFTLARQSPKDFGYLHKK